MTENKVNYESKNTKKITHSKREGNLCPRHFQNYRLNFDRKATKLISIPTLGILSLLFN
ncbi:MAG: hypothetical protein H6Q16_513 [Bacteroidetes bacterium]|nr:hypothetical protein [Bacteroidota bacterium]